MPSTCPYLLAVETSPNWKDFVPLISPIVVIILFIIDRIIGYNLRKKETDRNWYFKVLLEPSIEKITLFYKNTNSSYALAAKHLEERRNVPHTEFTRLKAHQFFIFQDSKRELEAEVIQPISARYQFVGNSLTLILQDLEDAYTKSIDEEKFSEEEINIFKLLAFTNRAILLNELYSPLQPSTSYFKKNWAYCKSFFSTKSKPRPR